MVSFFLKLKKKSSWNIRNTKIIELKYIIHYVI